MESKAILEKMIEWEIEDLKEEIQMRENIDPKLAEIKALATMIRTCREKGMKLSL